MASVCSPTVIASVIHENNAFRFTGIEILFQVSFKGGFGRLYEARQSWIVRLYLGYKNREE